MKKLLFSFLALSLLLVSACKEDPDPVITPTTTDLAIHFTPRYDGAPIDFAQNYLFDGKGIRFNLFTMFVSDLTLIKTNGDEVALSEVDYFDFTDAKPSDKFVIDRVYQAIETGDYKAVRMGIGVKESLNATSPNAYSPADVLGNSGAYWTGWQSYIFVRIQGDYDNLSDNSYATDLTYHVGANETYREVNIETPVTIAENGDFSIVFDMHDLFMMNGQPYDIVTNNQTPHGPGDITLATALMDNISHAFSIED